MWKWWLLLLFSVYAAAEVWAMLTLGGRLGVGWTMAWMVGTALLGAMVFRVGGVQALLRVHHKLRDEELPTLELVDMALVLVGALLLIAPGFIADALGLLLLLPPVRWLLKLLFCAIYGDLMPAPYAPGRGPMADEVIEIRRQE